MFCGRIVADAQSYRFDRRSFRSISGVRVTPRCLRIRVSHQIGNRRLTATRFREPGPERVTQIVPMKVFNPCSLTSCSERILDIGVRLGCVGIDKNVSTAASSVSHLL